MDTSANEYENIYEGLESESFSLDQEIDRLKTDNHMFEQHVISLEGDIEKLIQVLKRLKTAQKNLSDNISSLHRTAKAEIERKDRMIADLRHQLDNFIFKRIDIKPTTKDCNLTSNNKLKHNDTKGYNEGSGNNFQRKDNYKDRDRSKGRYSYGTKSTRTGNGRRYEERESRCSRESHKKRSRESHDEYEENHKLSRRKQSNESVGRSDECCKSKQGYLENDVVRKQILNMPKKNYIGNKIPKKKFKFVESMENKIKCKSLTPQNSFEEVYHETEDFKRSKCNRTNADFKSNNEAKSIEFSKYCSYQSINRETTNTIKIITNVISEKPHIVKLESNKCENIIENRLKHSEIEFKDKSSVQGKLQNTLDNSSKLLRTDCLKNRSNLEKDKYIAVAVINEIEKETEVSNCQSRQFGTLEFNMSNLESISSAESNTSIDDEEKSVEDGEIVDSTFIENLNIKDTISMSKSSVENYFRPILDDKESYGSLKITENYCNEMYVDISDNNCEDISTKDSKIVGVKNLEYEAREVNSVESFKNILPVTHQNKEGELICVLKTNDSNNVDNAEITSDRSNISLLDTVEDKVTKYSDMKSILQQTLLNNCESAGDMKKLMDDNRDCVLDGQNNKPAIVEKITVLSNIVLNANTNIVKDIINPRKTDVTSDSLQTVNVGSENQSEIEHELLDSVKNKKNEIKKLTETDNKNDTKYEMENYVENSKDPKIRRSTITKRKVSSSKNCQESSPGKQNKLITKLPIDRIEHDTIASLALLKISGYKSNSLENIKDENTDTKILLDKNLSHELVSTIDKSNLVNKIEDANVSDRQISDSSLLQDFNKSSMEKTENVRGNCKSLENVEEHAAKIDPVIKSLSSRIDVASCKSKLPETELGNSTVGGKRPSDSNVLEYQKSVLEELENSSKELIFEKLKNDGCARADKDCKVSEGESSSVEKLEIASCQSVPLNHVDEKTVKSGKDSSLNKGEQTNKKLTERLQITSRNSKSLERVEEQYSQDISIVPKDSSAKLENVSRKSNPLNEMEKEQFSKSGIASSYRDKNTSSGDCKNSGSDKMVSKSQLLGKNVHQNVAKKVSFEMDKYNCEKSSEKIENASSTKVKQTARKSETTRKKSKLNNKEYDSNGIKKEHSVNNQNVPSDVCKKSSSKKLETTTSKSQLAKDNNADESELKVSSTNNNISEDDKKSFPGNLEVTSSKLKSPSEILEYGNVTKRRKGSSRNSKDNSDNNEQPLDNSDKNIYAKRRKGQNDSVEKLGTKNMENILNESIEKADKLCTVQGALDAEKKSDIKSESHNDTISVKGENIENDMILSGKISDKHEVLDEKEIVEKGANNIHSEASKLATPTKPLIRRRITPTPVKDVKQVCSFANILEKNRIPESSPLHLTHEGEIPMLHIEENTFNNIQVEEAFKHGDSNIMKLLDTMHLSNMDSELSKFKSNTDNVDTMEPTNQLENRLTFENIMDKITPIESEMDSKTNNVSVNVKTTEDTCKAVGNTSSGNRKRRRICRVIVLE